MVKVKVSDELIEKVRKTHPEIAPETPATFVVDYSLRTLLELEAKMKEPVSVEVRANE